MAGTFTVAGDSLLCTIDAQALGITFDELRSALRRPPSFSGALNASLLAYDSTRIRETVLQVSDASRVARLELKQAFASVRVPPTDPEHVHRLAMLVTELTDLWRIRATMALGFRRGQHLRNILLAPAADMLAVLGRENDENAHSDLLRWMLDPDEAPNLAPVALESLVSRLPQASEWRARVKQSVALGCISVRREVVVGIEMKQDDNRDRIDLVISGPSFVIGLENKVWSAEHDEQTRSYARWLRALPGGPGLLRAGIFLSPSGMPAASPQFRSLSYLDLVACLLDAHATDNLEAEERQVVAGYLKTLHRRILRAEFNAILDMEGENPPVSWTNEKARECAGSGSWNGSKDESGGPSRLSSRRKQSGCARSVTGRSRRSPRTWI